MATSAFILSGASEGIRESVEKGGNTVIEIPAVTMPLDHSSLTVPEFGDHDWIVFPDAFAALHFAEFLFRQGIDLAELDMLRIAALTERTADAMTAISIHADLVSHTHSELFREILQYEGGIDGGNLKILVPCEASVLNGLSAGFADERVIAQFLPVYEKSSRPVSDLPKIKALLIGGAIDEINFCSLTDLETLSELFKDTDLLTILENVTLRSLNPRIADQLRRMSLESIPYK